MEKNSNNDDGSSSKEAQDLIEKEHSDDIEDLFQIEIVEGEELYTYTNILMCVMKDLKRMMKLKDI